LRFAPDGPAAGAVVRDSATPDFAAGDAAAGPAPDFLGLVFADGDFVVVGLVFRAIPLL
jgi:hypothetical protein